MITLTKMSRVTIACLFLAAGSMWTLAQENQPTGFKFNNLTVSPFVNLDYAYDSNVDYDKESLGDSILEVNPGVDLAYKGNDWGLTANSWFSYNKYINYTTLDALRYGDHVNFYKETAGGWRLVLGQSYLKSSQNDSIIDGGRGLWRNRDELGFNGALSYQASQKTSVTLTGMYNDLNYINDPANTPVPRRKYASDLYGWSEWALGLELAHKITEKSNLLLNGGYQNYISDGANGISSASTGYSLMAGFGSSATQKISYHALTGFTMFDYAGGDQLVAGTGGGGNQMVGWTYTLDSSWVINKKLVATVAGSSYFQPSETQQNQAEQVYALSSGLTYRPTPKLSTRFDLAFRREVSQFNTKTMVASTLDLYSARARADYQLTHRVSLYAGLEYQTQMSAEDPFAAFDRIYGTLGVNLKY